MLGRSDGVLNPGGIRFGSSELYDVINLCFSGEVTDCLAIGQAIDGGLDERVVLFLKLPHGQVLSHDLEQRVKSQIRQSLSPRHVPAKAS